jgi:hypothetical protein
LQVRRAHPVEEGVNTKGTHGADEHDEAHRSAHAQRRFPLGGDPDKRTDAQEVGEHEVVHQAGVEEDRSK